MGPTTGSTHDDEARFRALFEAEHRLVLAYALRRTARRDDAADVVADTFLVAWRRQHDVPSGRAARPWLLAVARRVLANQRRGVRRQERLGERLALALPSETVDEPGAISHRLHVEAALAALPDDEAELLRLTTWEGLSPAEVAIVLDLSPTAARSRIHRARRRLRAELASDDVAPTLGGEGAAP